MTTLCSAANITAALGSIGQADPQDLAVKATAAAENHCCRPLALSTRFEEHQPGTTRLINLKAYPVTGIERICTDLSGVIQIQATNSPWRATVTITTDAALGWGPPSGLSLSTLEGGTPATTDLSFDSLLTVQDLADAINTVGGWTATVTAGMGLCPTSELNPTLGSLGAVTAPAQLLAYATTIERYELKARIGKITLHQIRPDSYQYPDRTFGTLSPASKVLVVYSAGYNGDPANGPVTSPPDLVEACVQIARGILDARQFSGTVIEVDLGNTSYKIGEVVEIPDGARRLLSKYVDRRF
jgi:hypothetical protein